MKGFMSIVRLLAKMFETLMKLNLSPMSSYVKKLFDIEMQFSYIMDGNKFCTCPLKFLWVKHGLLLKP